MQLDYVDLRTVPRFIFFLFAASSSDFRHFLILFLASFAFTTSWPMHFRALCCTNIQRTVVSFQLLLNKRYALEKKIKSEQINRICFASSSTYNLHCLI